MAPEYALSIQMSRDNFAIAQFDASPYRLRMIIIAGIILGLAYGFYRGRQLSEVTADRVMYVASFGMAGFTAGLLITLFIQLLFG